MIISCDPRASRFLSSWVEARHGSVLIVESPEDAVRHCSLTRQTALVLDVDSSAGLRALKPLRNINRDTPIIAVARRGSTGRIVDAMKQGATDAMSAPFGSDEVDVVLGRVWKLQQNKDEIAAMRHE